MKTKTSLFSKLFFILTLAFYITACVIFEIILLAMDSLNTFLSQNAFTSLLYWIIVVASTAWYTYFYGFPKTQPEENSNKKVYPVVLAFFTPILVGMGIGVVVYYILYALSVLFMASIGYIITLLLVASLVYTTWFLIGLYFKPNKKMSPVLRQAAMYFSLIVAFGLLLLSIHLFFFRM
jgi:hypothetical protein